MKPETETDHIALLALTITGLLVKRLDETGQLDQHTAKLLHRLVVGVRKHASSRGLEDLHILFDNLDNSLTHTLKKAAS